MLIDLSEFASVADAVHAVAAKVPARVALLDQRRSWTFAELDDRVCALARMLLDRGAWPGQHCGLLMENVAEHLIAHLGALRAGLVVVPLSPRNHPHEIAQQIASTDIGLLVLSPALARTVCVSHADAARLLIRSPSDKPSAGEDAASIDELPPSDRPFPMRGRGDPYAIWHTSGTTGRPKGVIHDNNSGLHAAAAWIRTWNFTPADRSLVKNLFHVGMTASVIAPLLAGASLAMMHGSFSLRHLLEDLSRYRVTFFSAAPAMLSLFDKNPDLVRKYDLSALRVVTTGSAPIDPALLGRVVDLLPSHVQWTQSYGQTEINTGGCCLAWADFFDRMGSIGKPIDCVRAMSVRADDGSEVPVGEVGELCMQGPTVTTGYYGKPDVPARTDLWHRTGDLARIDAQGFYWLAGRKRDLIIRGGENIYPSEVERIVQSHAAVQEAVVVGMPDSVMGELPVAFVELRPNAICDAESLLMHCRNELAQYKCPVHVEIVAELPRNNLGKVLRSQLAARAIDLASTLGR